LPDLKGSVVSLADLLERGPVLLAFFKISCPVCQYAFPLLERLHRAYPDASIVGVSQNSSRDTERFCREFGVTFPILLDAPGTYMVSNAYGLTNVPTVFYIGEDGTIEVSSVGWSRREVEDIARLLGAAQNVSPAQLFKPDEQITDFRAG
jgi:peroxiredoxin